MPGVAKPAGSCRAIERRVNAIWRAPPIARGNRCARTSTGGQWLRLAVEPDRLVIVCHTPHTAGAGEALALAERVSALFRHTAVGGARFGSPMIDLDGRDPDGFRAVVTLPIRWGRLD